MLDMPSESVQRVAQGVALLCDLSKGWCLLLCDFVARGVVLAVVHQITLTLGGYVIQCGVTSSYGFIVSQLALGVSSPT